MVVVCKRLLRFCLVDAQSGDQMSFSDLLRRSSSISAGLAAKGLSAGDVVVLCCDKGFLSYCLLLGTMFTGCTAVLVHTSAGDQIHHFTEGHTVKAVFCTPEVLPSVSSSVKNMDPPPLMVAAVDPEDLLMAELINSHEPFALYDVEDTRSHVPLVLFSSGSTGRPKGVEVTDVGLQRLGYSFDDEAVARYLLTGTFAWISSPISFVSSILKNYCLVLGNAKEPAAILRQIDKYKVNGWTVPASHVNLYSNEPSLAEVDLSSLQIVIVGGAVLRKRVTELFIEKVLGGRIGVQSLYGLTECGILTSWKGTDLLDLNKADSSGYLAPGVEMKILDGNGIEVAVGSLGEIWAKSASLMRGYWGDEKLTPELMDEEGFFRTGDAAYFDEDGHLFVQGRAGDLVTIHGKKISVKGAEDVLLSHPAVLEAAIVASSSTVDTHRLVAFVVKRPGHHISPEEVIALTSGHFGKVQTLTGVHFMDKLPRTPNTKIQMKVLQDKLSDPNFNKNC